MNHILQNWKECRNRGTIPLVLFDLKNDDVLLVQIDVTETEIQFNMDVEHGEPRFDGEIIGENGSYSIVYDIEYDTLDGLLELVMQNINEGYIAVYGLYPEEEEESS